MLIYQPLNLYAGGFNVPPMNDLGIHLLVSRFGRLENRTMVTCQIFMITCDVVADSVYFLLLCYLVATNIGHKNKREC